MTRHEEQGDNATCRLMTSSGTADIEEEDEGGGILYMEKRAVGFNGGGAGRLWVA